MKPIRRKQLLWVGLGVAILAGGVAGGCYPKSASAPGPVSASGLTWAAARWPGVTTESLGTGRALFIAHCNKCHDYPAMTAVSEEKWPGTVEKMGKKAHLAPEQRELVLHFILTARSEQVAKPCCQ